MNYITAPTPRTELVNMLTEYYCQGTILEVSLNSNIVKLQNEYNRIQKQMTEILFPE